MTQLEIFIKNFSGDNFEDYSHENGFTYWYASDLMNLLGYENMTSFQRAINKAMTTCNTLNIPILDNFFQEQRIIDNKSIMDFRLSRFACYLTVMNADSKKNAVAMAQSYFATLAGAVQNYLEEANKVERLVIRDEISERETSLSGVVHKAGVENYPFFQNAGYRGLYNKNISQLKMIRNIPTNKSLLDFMGKEELAANLFRITQTELKIKQDNIKGQQKLENTAENVGKKVRQTMKDISGILPEQLPKHEDIKTVKQQLKAKSKQIKELDSKKKKKS
ncbi:MAG: damage-inducible protein D [Bacteroidetes bacterium GWA2_30_7]|nr:MAG: damage-inducible protein D [Bacteroidetes bacterium GWA2_30_7]